MPRTLHRQLQEQAAAEGVSFNQFVVSILARAAGAGPRSEDGAGATAQFELSDRLGVIEERATAVEERTSELEDWCPDLEDRLVDLEDEWIEQHPRLQEREVVRGLVETDSEQFARRVQAREDREKRIRARYDARQADPGAQE